MVDPSLPQSDPRSTRVVQLTPPGRGAISTLLVEGPDATERVEQHFRPSAGGRLGEHPLRRIVFGHFRVGSHPREEVVACRRSAESIELHCHGGHVAATRILAAFVEQGCRTAGWREWAADHHRDRIAAEAFARLADARTERTAAVLLDQHHGALRRALESIDRQLRAGRTESALAELRALLARADTGRHLTSPWRVLLAGSPNVGKSSLINALAGHERAIVHPTAGTTRDVVSVATAIDGWPVEFADTAGLHEGDDRLEQAAVELARRESRAADLVLLVFDAGRRWSESDAVLMAEHPEALVVHNKCDLVACRGELRPGGCFASALAGQGIETLLGAIVERLVPQPPPPGAAVPFTTEQIECTKVAASALERQGDPRAAIAALGNFLR